MTRIVALVALVAVLAVGACGKFAGPTQPGPADQITYPKTYPTH